MAQIIGVSSSPNQVLAADLNINGSSISVLLSVGYNRISNFWAMDIATPFGIPIVSSVPLLTGSWPAANILMPFQYLNIGSAFILNVSGGRTDRPLSSNLGTSFLLLWDNNSDYVSNQQFGGNMFVVGPPGPSGPPGPQGLPGAVGGVYVMGSSGTLTPSPGDTQFTQLANLTGNATIAAPSSIVPGAVFMVQLVQPALGGKTVAWNVFYTGVNTFALDTTGNTQAVLMFQINTAGTHAQLMNVAQNGWSIV